jgi:hypothetical protein
MSIDNESDLYSFETVRQDVITVNGHKYSSPSILRYPHFSIFFIVKSFLNGFWSFLHQKKQKYLKIIYYFSMIFRLIAFIFLWFKDKFAIYFNKNKIGKINICV